MDMVLQHWSFLAVATILAVVGVAAKRILWTSTSGWRGLGKATMPAHPVLFGGLIGLVPSFPAPEYVTGMLGVAVFYAFAGACSAWVYDLVRAWFGRKTDAVAPEPAKE